MPSSTEQARGQTEEQPWYAALPASGPGPSVRWTSDGFETELRDWLAGALTGLGSELATLEAVHQRPWSTVWKVVATDGRTYWAKQNCRHQAFEADLLVALDRLAPDRVVPVVAADSGRGLHLVPDQGPVFAETVADDDIEAWCRVAAEAMLLQRELVGHQRELLEAGVIALSPGESTPYVEARIASLTTLPADDPRRMDAQTAAGLHALLPEVDRWAASLESLGLANSLVHNDLHAHNVFATPEGMRFFDFGDALLAHPLSALFVPLNILLHRLETQPDDPRLRRVADAALEVWSDVVAPGELRAALPAALRFGRIGRAESWFRVTATMTAPELAKYGDAGTWWLGALGDPPPLARPH